MDVDEGVTAADVEAAIPTRKVLSRTNESLPCILTIEERLARGTSLSGILEDIQNEESQQEDEKRAMKSRLATLEARLHEMQLIVSRGREHRSVEVESIADYKAGKLFRIRTDVGEVIGERPLTDQEMQVSFLVPTDKPV